LLVGVRLAATRHVSRTPRCRRPSPPGRADPEAAQRDAEQRRLGLADDDRLHPAAAVIAATMAPQPGRKSPSSIGSRGSTLGVTSGAPAAAARAAAARRS
jgi:hypothetical protein